MTRLHVCQICVPDDLCARFADTINQQAGLAMEERVRNQLPHLPVQPLQANISTPTRQIHRLPTRATPPYRSDLTLALSQHLSLVH